MSTLFYKLIRVALSTALLLGAAVLTATAATLPSTTRADAGAPLADSVTIEPGVVQWYKFKYQYDGSDAKATVLLKMDAANCVGFDIETPGSLAAPAVDENGKKREPVGRGSPLTKKEADFDPANEAETAEDAEDTNDNGKIDDSENPYNQQDHGIVKNEQVLVWVGSAGAKETFYVVVKNRSNAACAYKLTISGPTVSFPGN